MKNIMLKNAFAAMKKSKSRFFSIFGIIAIGTGFFAGLLSSAPAMRISSDHYYDRTSLLDYRLVSTYGFDDNDIKALKESLDGECISRLLYRRLCQYGYRREESCKSIFA